MDKILIRTESLQARITQAEKSLSLRYTPAVIVTPEKTRLGLFLSWFLIVCLVMVALALIIGGLMQMNGIPIRETLSFAAKVLGVIAFMAITGLMTNALMLYLIGA